MRDFNKLNLPMEDIARDYLAGVPANRLATKHGVTCHTIINYLRKFGIETRKHAEAYTSLSKEDRVFMTAAAHAAKRGKPMKESSKLASAITVEQNALQGRGIGVLEQRFIEWMLVAYPEIDYTPQKAVGIYNIDIALTQSCIAVEIFGGNWHNGGKHAARYRPRIEYLLGAGWLPVVIWATRDYPLTETALEYVVSLYKVRDSDKTKTTEEHVIWGTGEFIPVSQRDPKTGAKVRSS